MNRTWLIERGDDPTNVDWRGLFEGTTEQAAELVAELEARDGCTYSADSYPTITGPDDVPEPEEQ